MRLMIDALSWGGASFHGAGWNPRHIEGAEHFIFYALEAATRKKFLHGQAVCLGVVIACMMHGERADELLGVMHSVGIDIRPEAMAINWQDVDQALLGLSAFVRREQLAYGIAHDFKVDAGFLRQGACEN